MTPEEITAMAKEAGMHIDRLPDDYCKDVGLPIGSMSRCGGVGIDELQAFAAQVAEKAAAQEREACCEPDVTNSAGICAADMPHVVVQKYQSAIRARGQKGGV